MNKLSLNDSQHAQQVPNGNHGGFQRSAYIPPHARSSGRGPAPNAGLDGVPSADAAGGDVQNGAWPAQPQAQ